MAYNSLYEWQEIEALELGNKKIDELRKEINNKMCIRDRSATGYESRESQTMTPSLAMTCPRHSMALHIS